MSKMIPVTCSSMPPMEEYVALLQRVWDTKRLSNFGPLHQELEEKLREYMGVSHLALFSSGHMALELALSCLPKVPGGEIITTAYSFCSTVNAIVRNGYAPVFCDIKKNDFTLDPKGIEERITSKTLAIVATHVYGFVCDDAAIGAIAQKHGLKVIYDAAHAFGVQYKGKSVAQLGDMSMFSTHATKVFHTVEGGILCLKDEKSARRVRELSNFGLSAAGEVLYPGPNAKMNELEAAMGLCNLRHVEEEILKRKQVAERYRRRLFGKEGLYLPMPSEESRWNYAYFPVLFEKGYSAREQAVERLTAQGILPRKYFAPALHQSGCYGETYGKYVLPVTEGVAAGILTLPLYAELSLSEVDRICDIMLNEGGFSK